MSTQQAYGSPSVIGSSNSYSRIQSEIGVEENDLQFKSRITKVVVPRILVYAPPTLADTEKSAPFEEYIFDTILERVMKKDKKILKELAKY